MKVLVGAFNQEKALVGAFSVIVQPVVEPMEYYTALDRMYTLAGAEVRSFSQLRHVHHGAGEAHLLAPGHRLR